MKRKRIIALTVFALLFSNISHSQILNLDFLDQLTTTSFEKIDELMTNGFGYEKLLTEDSSKSKQFVKFDTDNPGNFMSIKIVSNKDFEKNALDIKIGKNYSLKKIKNNLSEKGFLYGGFNKYGLTVYKKSKKLFLIAKEPNEFGATQIIITYEK
jgi:hypothetical protein